MIVRGFCQNIDTIGRKPDTCLLEILSAYTVKNKAFIAVRFISLYVLKKFGLNYRPSMTCPPESDISEKASFVFAVV